MSTNLAVFSTEIKSVSAVRRRAREHGFIMKRTGANRFVLHRTVRIQPTFKGRRVEMTRLEPVTDALSLDAILDLANELDGAIERELDHQAERAMVHTMPTLFEQPHYAAETAALQ